MNALHLSFGVGQVLRLVDFFYHKEHLIIVTELLRDNLYEFSKFNRDSKDQPYFTLGKLQRVRAQAHTNTHTVTDRTVKSQL